MAAQAGKGRRTSGTVATPFGDLVTERDVVLSVDLDNDKVPDIEVIKTNGHTVYVSQKWLAKVVSAILAAIASVAVAVKALL